MIEITINNTYAGQVKYNDMPFKFICRDYGCIEQLLAIKGDEEIKCKCGFRNKVRRT